MNSKCRMIFYSFVIGVTLLASTGSPRAQLRPAMHWGSMDLQTGLQRCLGRADKAFYDAGVRNVQRTGWQRYGEKGNANIIVSCSPKSNGASYLVVVAASGNSREAELLRNDIRTRIANMREID
jgi:hypothetical protein